MSVTQFNLWQCIMVYGCSYCQQYSNILLLQAVQKKSSILLLHAVQQKLLRTVQLDFIWAHYSWSKVFISYLRVVCQV